MFFSRFSRKKKQTWRFQEHDVSWYYFLTLAQESSDVFWVLTPSGEMREIYPSWQNFTGQEARACLGRGWLDAFHPADRVLLEGMLLQAVSSGQPAEMEGHICAYDNTYRLIHMRALPVHMPNKALRALIICGNDVLKPEVAEQMSSEQVQLAVKASRVGLWDWHFITNKLVWTDQEKALFGLPASTQITYERFIEAVHPDDREYVKQLRQPALTSTPERGENFRTIWPDGSIHWLENRAQAIYDAQGRPVRLVGATMDVTDLKHLERALRESEVRFRRLEEANIIGISVTDLQGNILEANDALLSFLDYTREDLIAGRMCWIEMTPPEYKEQSMQKMQELRATGVMQPFEKEFLTKAGKRVPALLGSALFHQEDSEPLMLTFILDLTARKELERQKDLMLGMTSHELKTPLTALKGTFQLIQRRLKRLVTQTDILPDVHDALVDLAGRLDTCARQVDVQTHLINDLLDVSRITANTLKLELSYTDLVSIVRTTVADLRMVAPERIILLEIPEGTVARVYVDATRISQVITNYVTNAIRYSSAEQPISVGLSIQEQEVARVWVRDRGPGLTAEAQQELWQCFHQVKGVAVQGGLGKGLGLGLYICQTLIAQHQGEVGVESTPGEGSTFWFTLPLAT
jgi:PAS domain S-box-containing protein